MDNQIWKTNLIDKVLKSGEDIIETLKQQCKKNDIKKFYKYREGNDDDIKNLYDNVLYASIGSKFNDPFEFWAPVMSEGDSNIMLEEIFGIQGKEIRTLLSKKNVINTKGHNIEDFEEEYRNKKVCDPDKYYSLCLTSRNDSILMWSHYSKYHKGFCIEYNASDLIEMEFILPIIYTNKPISLFKEQSIKVLLQKYKDWEYEKEWRVLKKREDISKSSIPIKMPKPSAIYLGWQIENRTKYDGNIELKKILMKYCKDNNILCYKAERCNEKYELNFKKIDLYS